MKIEPNIVEFEWGEGNTDKNKKHRVEDFESEEVFSDENKFIFTDELHSHNEERLRLLGRTKKGRILFVVFTRRGNKIRIASSRDVNKREVRLYMRKKLKLPRFKDENEERESSGVT